MATNAEEVRVERSGQPPDPYGSDPRREDEVARLTEALQAAQQRLDELVTLDSVTQTLNRTGLTHVLAGEISRASRLGLPPVAILIGCDNFARIHHQFGYAVGDEVLMEVARRIRSTLRASDCVARVGESEFLVILPDAGYWEALQIAERMRRKIGRPLPFGGPEAFQVSASLGVCCLPELRMTAEEVMALARAQLNKARDASTLASYRELLTADAGPSLPDRLLAEGTFYAVREPILRLADGRLVGYELLSRARISGLEAPEDFLGVALTHNILTSTDLQCVKAAVAGAKSVGDPALVYHLNVFPTTLVNTPPERVIELLARAYPLKFCIEVTEQQFFGDSHILLERLAALRAAGLQVALDDVGFGRTSLELLILLAPDIVKIDQRFVRGVARQAAHARAFQRLVDVIRTVGANIIAEGVEEDADARTMQGFCVEYAQGRYFEHVAVRRPAERDGSVASSRKRPDGPPSPASRAPRSLAAPAPIGWELGRASRHAVSVPALYRAAGERNWRRGRTLNLSDTGILFETAHTVPVGSLAELTFYLPEPVGNLPRGQVTCLGTVVRHAGQTTSLLPAAGARWLEIQSDSTSLSIQ